MTANNFDEDAFFFAISNKKNQDLKEMLNDGVNPNTIDQYGQNGLMRAILAKNNSAIDILINANADVNLADCSEKTALHYIVYEHVSGYKNRLAITQQLLLAGASPNAKNSESLNGDTPLMIAVKEREFDCAYAMIDAGADLNIQNACGITVLMLCVETKYIKMAMHLLNHGADMHLADLNGYSAYSLAKQKQGACFDLFNAHKDKQSLNDLVCINQQDSVKATLSF